MNIVFGKFRRLLLAFLLKRSPKSIAGHMLPSLPFFLASWISVEHDFKKSQPTACKYIQHYWYYPTAASSRMSPKNLQPLSPCAGVHLKPGSNGSALGLWTDASSSGTQPHILSSTCWTYYSWPALSFCQITSRRIRFASGLLTVCLLHHPSPTNRHSH